VLYIAEQFFHDKYKYDILEIITKNNKNNKITTKNVNYRKMRLRDK